MSDEGKGGPTSSKTYRKKEGTVNKRMKQESRTYNREGGWEQGVWAKTPQSRGTLAPGHRGDSKKQN